MTDISLEEIFKEVKIKSKYTKIKILNGKNYREYHTSNNWKPCCCFSKEECYNFQVNGKIYCKKHENGIQTVIISQTAVGDLIEDHVFELLKQCPNLTNIKNIGQENCTLDIVYQVKEEISIDINHMRGIQVKKLIEQSLSKYEVKDINKYDSNTIIVAINLERNIYCIFNNTMIGVDSFWLNPKNPNPKYREFCFIGTNSRNSYGNTFLDLLNQWSITSTIYSHNCFNSNNLKEKLMTDALKIECQKYNLKCESHSSSDSCIDCIINDTINCQLKFSDRTHRNMYAFSMFKTINSNVSIPYSESDNIHFFVFSYLNPLKECVFYIIPIKVLIYYEYISTSTSSGKHNINLLPLEFKDNHWTKKFINRFDLFTNEFDMNELIDLNDMFDRFQYECKKINIICIRDMDNLSVKHFNIGDKLCKYSESNTKKHNYYDFTIQINSSKPYNIDTDIIPDFFIFRIKVYPNHFWIIPKQKLIDEKIIASNLIKGTTKISFPIPGNTNKGKAFLNDYLIKYDDLPTFI